MHTTINNITARFVSINILLNSDHEVKLVRMTITQIAHLGWATSGPPAPVAATVGPPVAHPPHQRRAI